MTTTMTTTTPTRRRRAKTTGGTDDDGEEHDDDEGCDNDGEELDNDNKIIINLIIIYSICVRCRQSTVGVVAMCLGKEDPIFSKNSPSGAKAFHSRFQARLGGDNLIF